MAEVAPVMTFSEWVCSGGFQIMVGSWSWFAPVVFGFQFGSGDDFFDRRGFVFVSVFVVCARG